MPIPSVSDIKDGVERQENFLSWLVAVWRNKNWVRILLLAEALLIAFCNPAIFAITTRYLGIQLPAWYTAVWSLVVGILFISALIVALRNTATSSQPILDERQAVKGLRPFSFSDSEIFSRLQRDDILRDCLVGIIDESFRLGILCGESGSGKTSFLQAGLWPNLLSKSHHCIYVKFTDLDPLLSVRRVFSEQFRLSDDKLAGEGLIPLLEAAAGSVTVPIVLIFDQFEQFFIHYKRRNDRKPFIRELVQWYQRKNALPIKILICVRGDFSDRLIELQKSMGYSLGPHEIFRIEKFEPRQATAVFRVIADTEGLRFDEDFVREMATQELASSEDGLISPVDIQILAWMITGQQTGQDRAFSRITYQKLGGIEGLLERFLKRALEARETESRKQAALKILLLLTDLERNTRAGALTIEELKAKIAGTTHGREIEDAVDWLARSDVRLITPSRSAGAFVYELAHERLIPSLQRLAGKELSAADQATQLLNRRVNEWLGNGRARRFLLNWREIRLVENYRPYLVWEPQKSHKEALLIRSKQLLRYKIGGVVGPFLLLVAYFIYLAFLLTPNGQIRQVKQEILSLSSGTDSVEVLHSAAGAFASIGDVNQAAQLMDKINSYDRTTTTKLVIEVYVKIGESRRSEEFIKHALTLIEPLTPPERILYLLKIAETYNNIGNKQKANEILVQAYNINKGLSLSVQAKLLADIAAGYISLGEYENARNLLIEARKLAEKFPDYNALFTRIKTYAKLDEKTHDTAHLDYLLKITVERLDTEPKSAALTTIIRAYAKIAEETKDEALLDKAISVAEVVGDADKAEPWTAIAEGYKRLGNSSKAVEFLQGQTKNILTNAKSHDRVALLRQIAEAYFKINEIQKSFEVLDSANAVAHRLENPETSKSLAKTYTEIGSISKDKAFLLQATEVAKDLQSRDRITTLSEISVAYSKIGEQQMASEILEQAFEKTIDDESLSIIAEANAKIGRWRQARRMALDIENDKTRAITLSRILAAWAVDKDPSLAEILGLSVLLLWPLN